MKYFVLTFILLFTINYIGKTQTIRYFEFVTQCGPGNWQDTSFIATASDQTLIDTVLANIARPLYQRKFINGLIDYGNGGFNHNASHWFLWHFIPYQWSLAEMAVEVCDGCPYSDVDADTAYWIGNLGRFCPWSGRPAREINPSRINEQYFENEFLIYPNPANDELKLKWNGMNNISVTIFNPIGQEFKTIVLNKQIETIDLTQFKTGFYFLRIINGNKIKIKKLIICKKQTTNR